MFDRTTVYLLEHPWIFVVQGFFALCFATGVWSRNRIFRPANKQLRTRSIPHTAHWIPWIGNAYAGWLSSRTLLDKKSRDCQSPVYATTIYGHDYVVLTDGNSLGDLLQSGKVKPKLADPNTISRRFFGNSNITVAKGLRKQQMMQIYQDDGKKVDAVASLLSTHAYNLISPAQSWVDQAQWERTSDAKVIDTEPTLTVSASLNVLIRDFSAYILLCPLLGRSFLEANPDFVPDMFRFGSSYNSFMRGLPYWIMPGLGPPAFAREKCLRALDGLIRAITAEQTDQSVIGLGDAVLYDVDEVHSSILYAVRHAREEDNEKPSIRTVSKEILEFLFELTHYYVYEILWLLIYLIKYREQSIDVMDTIRVEIKQFVKVVKPPPSGLPFEDPPQLLFDRLNQGTSERQKRCPKLSSIINRVVKQEGSHLREFTVPTNCSVELGSVGKDKQSLRFELAQEDRILAMANYSSNDAITSSFGRGESAKSSVDFLARSWIIAITLITLYDLDTLGSSSISFHVASNHSASSMSEPRRSLQGRVARRPVL